MAVYAWNKENLRDVAECLDKESDKLQEQKRNLESYRQVVETNYQGDAAIEFLKNLDADIVEAEKISTKMQDEARLLRKISIEVYQNCEDELERKVRVLQGELW